MEGYIDVNITGAVLNSTVTITGLYAIVDRAYKTGKMIRISLGDGRPFAPSVALRSTTGEYVIVWSEYQIEVASNDAVTMSYRETSQIGYVEGVLKDSISISPNTNGIIMDLSLTAGKWIVIASGWINTVNTGRIIEGDGIGVNSRIIADHGMGYNLSSIINLQSSGHVGLYAANLTSDTTLTNTEFAGDGCRAVRIGN